MTNRTKNTRAGFLLLALLSGQVFAASAWLSPAVDAGLIGSTHTNQRVTLQCPNNKFLVGVRVEEGKGTSPFPQTRGIVADIDLLCATVQVSTGGAITVTHDAGYIGLSRYGDGDGVQDTATCPAGQVVTRMAGDSYSDTRDSQSANGWLSNLHLSCQALTLDASNRIRATGTVTTRIAGEKEVDSHRTDLFDGPFCGASSNEFVRGVFAYGGGLGWDGVEVKCGTIGSDHGDAPASYGSAGQEINSAVYLGAEADTEAAAQSSASAAGDDAVAASATDASVDDEDGVAPLPAIAANANTYSVTVRASNRLASATATLAGWIDFNRNGSFDAAEGVTRSVPAGTNAADLTLTWSGVSGLVTNGAGPTYARFRIVNGSLDASQAAATFADAGGEAEDHAVTIVPYVAVSKTTKLASGGPFSVALTNTTPATATVSTAAADTPTQVDADPGVGGIQNFVVASLGSNVTLNEPGLSSDWVLESIACVNQQGTAIGSLSSGTYTIPAASLTGTASITCAIANTSRAPVLTLQKALGGAGRISASDQFSLSGTGAGAPAARITAGSGSAVTSPAYSFRGASGNTYTLDEAMAPGSASALGEYKQAVACTNIGGTTDVSGFTSLPIRVTPVAGDNISCTVINTPASGVVSGRVFLDNGAGGGTANDGIRNGGEGPQVGVAMRLTNCAGAVHASTLTSDAGGYSFTVPTGVASGAALCVEEQANPATRVSTGASISSTATGTALPSGTATGVSGTSYTYTRAGTPERIAFTWNGIGHSSLDFGDVENSTFAVGGAKTGLPGNTVNYAHTFTAGTGGQVRFSIPSQSATPAIGGWTEEIHADPGCTGALQSGAAQLYPPAGTGTVVAFAGQVCIIVRQFIPANAPMGANNKVVVQADFSYANAAPALSATYTLEDITTVSAVALELKKEVRNVTQGAAFGVNNQAKSGETLEYRITYTNNGPAPISGMTVNDTTPAYTSFVSASAGTTPATLTACVKNTPANALPAPAVACANAQLAGGTGPIDWKFTGSIAPGGTGFVLFQVKVD